MGPLPIKSETFSQMYRSAGTILIAPKASSSSSSGHQHNASSVHQAMVHQPPSAATTATTATATTGGPPRPLVGQVNPAQLQQTMLQQAGGTIGVNSTLLSPPHYPNPTGNYGSQQTVTAMGK